VGRPDGKIPFGIPLHRLKGQVAGSCECGNEPSDTKKCKVYFWLAEDFVSFMDSPVFTLVQNERIIE
jgi:hypothetical protein